MGGGGCRGGGIGVGASRARRASEESARRERIRALTTPSGGESPYSTTSSSYGRFLRGGGKGAASTSVRTQEPGSSAPRRAQQMACPNIGLSNLGNTCFMNSILQCLVHVPELVQGLRGGQVPTQAKITQAFSRLVKKMQDAEPRGSVTPSEFLRAARSLDRRWMGARQHDAQELLNSVLDEMRKECNRNKTKPTYKELVNRPDLSEQADEAWQYARSWHDSFIDDIFMGQLVSSLQCQVCGFKSHCFDPFLDLSLPLPRARGASVHLTDCLSKFTAEEDLANTDGYKCEKCKKSQPVKLQLCIYRYPPVLVLHLKRFSSSSGFFSSFSKTDTAVGFNIEELDLSRHCHADAACSAPPTTGGMSLPPRYELLGVSQHSGTMSGGHYTALAREPGGRWYSFNDSMVSPSEATSPSSSAYVLFFRIKGGAAAAAL